MPPAKNILQILKNSFQSLRPTGALFILGSALFLLLPGIQEQDLLASVLGVSGLIISLTVFLLGLCQRILLKKVLVRISASGKAPWFPEKPIPLTLRLERIRLVPLWDLDLRICFKTASGKACLIQHSAKKLLTEDCITLPHRGKWPVTGITLAAFDRLSLFRFSHDITETHSDLNLEVIPPLLKSTRLPILPSSYQEGVQIPDRKHQSGDLYEIKQYHPADGARKILWKVFARSGVLMSRHPEQTVNPEGQVFIFCLADQTEDFVCSACLSYIRKMEQAEIETTLSCKGAGGKCSNGYFDSLNLLTNSVWESDYKSPDKLTSEVMEALNSHKGLRQNSQLRTALIFCNARQSDDFIMYKTAGKLFSSCNIAPVFMLIESRENRLQEDNTPVDWEYYREELNL